MLIKVLAALNLIVLLAILSAVGYFLYHDRKLIHDAIWNASAASYDLKTKTSAELTETEKATKDLHQLLFHTDCQLNGCSGAGVHVAGMLPRLNKSINDELVPELRTSLNETTHLQSTAASTITEISSQLRPSFDNMALATQAAARDLNDPSIGRTLEFVAKSSANLADTSLEVKGIAADAHTESSLLVKQTQKAFEPEAKWLTILKASGGTAVTLIELLYYLRQM